MKLKKLLVAVCVLTAIMAVGGLAVMGANGEAQDPPNWEEFFGEGPRVWRGPDKDFDGEDGPVTRWFGGEDGETPKRFSGRFELTEEQREELNALQGQIIDKYLEWGLIDEEAAALMKDALKNGPGFGLTMPCPGMRGGFGGKNL